MGWFYSNQSSKKLFIQELTKGWKRDGENGTQVLAECIASCSYDGILWTVWEASIRKEGLVQQARRWINCDLMEYRRDAGWGNKPIGEEMGPCYYSCPLKYLKLVPIEVHGGNASWRESVMAYHDERKARRRGKLSLAIS